MSMKKRLATASRLRKDAKDREAAAVFALQEAQQAVLDAQQRLGAVLRAMENESTVCQSVISAGAAAASARYVRKMAQQADTLRRVISRCEDIVAVRRAAVLGIRQQGHAFLRLEERLALLHANDERAREQETVDRWGHTVLWREGKR